MREKLKGQVFDCGEGMSHIQQGRTKVVFPEIRGQNERGFNSLLEVCRQGGGRELFSCWFSQAGPGAKNSKNQSRPAKRLGGGGGEMVPYANMHEEKVCLFRQKKMRKGKSCQRRVAERRRNRRRKRQSRCGEPLREEEKGRQKKERAETGRHYNLPAG